MFLGKSALATTTTKTTTTRRLLLRLQIILQPEFSGACDHRGNRGLELAIVVGGGGKGRGCSSSSSSSLKPGDGAAGAEASAAANRCHRGRDQVVFALLSIRHGRTLPPSQQTLRR